jgi:hypothetical protein
MIGIATVLHRRCDNTPRTNRSPPIAKVPTPAATASDGSVRSLRPMPPPDPSARSLFPMRARGHPTPRRSPPRLRLSPIVSDETRHPPARVTSQTIREGPRPGRRPGYVTDDSRRTQTGQAAGLRHRRFERDPAGQAAGYVTDDSQRNGRRSAGIEATGRMPCEAIKDGTDNRRG